jgi:CubicO group peptidase (beta-lactamase class C family)
MTDVHGFCDERFEPLRAMLAANQDAGIDNGAAIAATLGGEPVVDLWAGHRDRKGTEPWEKDTLVCVFSCSKVMVIITTLMVWDRGLIDLHTPIAEYWPEFGQHGKEAITPWQVLVHRAGLPGFGQTVGFDELHDWDRLIGILEAEEPWYEPGTTSCYHNLTFGFILGELVHRVTGRRFETFFREEVAEPLGADFHFGVTSAADQARVAQLQYAALPPAASEMAQRLRDEMEPGDWVVPARMAAVIPAGNGIGNARSLARIGALLAMGGSLDGRRYLSRETIVEATREHSFEDDVAFGPLRMGLGFGLDSPAFPAPTPTSFHWGGYGGSFITMDMELGLSCAFTPNRLLQDGSGIADDARLAATIHTIGEVAADLTDN